MSRLLLLALLLGICAAAPASDVETLEITSADRKLRALGYRVQIRTSIAVVNTGKAPIASSSSGQRETPLKGALVVLPEAPHNVTCLRFQLNAPLPPKGTLDFEVVGVYVGTLEPWPRQAPADAPTLALYRDSAALVSPYPVRQQTFKMELGRIESVEAPGAEVTTKGQGAEVRAPGATPPFRQLPFAAHFEVVGLFVKGRSARRRVDVSPVGASQFDEEYEVEHRGAALKGEWSRLDYISRTKKYGPGAVSGLHVTGLPANAANLYFRDGIGNISSSAVQRTETGVRVLLQPRYPLFGGWTTDFKFGCVTEVAFDEAELKVILPPGATLLNVELPMEVERRLEVTHDFLSLVGRTVVVLRRPMYVPELNVPLRVTFKPGGTILEKSTAWLVTGAALVAGASIVRRIASS
ncbi:Dolichyl-diphosphooligosaccharide-protein glycosyltransferase subunit 1 [Auxenochlorella protothecoides]|uniref:Dolichyl-diphosphooligosaccharide--protein glycosyltransferase subunit 1 n=1 Tax=Auxenochlorella protothecoides TaxID=3075 RepID=A0A087SQY6_AUXPR|nr:Dolichyl-diphosphooligosaccharide-protein glycosyltransferase subunit 1 [Auxenochlorella protothecoides]KFM28140.1 Dolichyl-diphosphooligosaccharide-protein glycosyltransferase subunit 1 [Auxenochlorella protothecoides]